MAYEALVPPAIDRIELAVARAMALFANANRSKGAKAFVAKDFMPDFLADATADTVQTPNQQYAALSYITGMLGGKVFPDDATDEEMEAYVLQGVDISEYAGYDEDEEMQGFAADDSHEG